MSRPPSPVAHRLKLLAGYLRGQAVCPGLPLTAVIAATRRCNMACRMCLRAVMPFDGPDLEMALFRKIIDEGAPWFRYVCLDGPGETTLHPEVFDMVRYARARGIRTVFSTNASTFDAVTCDAILDSGLDQIILSVNGTTPEVYAAVHGVDGYEDAVARIRRFLARKRERRAKIMVSVQMIRLPETLPQVGDFYRMCGGSPASISCG